MYSYGITNCDDYFCDDTQTNFIKKNVMYETISLNTSNYDGQFAYLHYILCHNLQQTELQKC